MSDPKTPTQGPGQAAEEMQKAEGRMATIPSRASTRVLALLPAILVGLSVWAFLGQWGENQYSAVLADSAASVLDARKVFTCVRDAYPDRDIKVYREEKDRPWTLDIEGHVFIWVNGRILPPDDAGDWEKYRINYDYLPSRSEIDPRSIPKETLERLKDQAKGQRQIPPTHPGYNAALFGGSTKAEVYDKQVSTRFLGRPITVNRLIAPAIARIDARVAKEKEGSAELSKFLTTIGSVGCFNWRLIRGQNQPSIHSYGMAVDVLPKNHERTAVYWLWESERRDNWASVPLSERWRPPESFIRAFEDEGFVWGGKWLDYDNMHFEYRPELILMRERYFPEISR